MEDLFNAILPVYKVTDTTGTTVVINKKFSLGACSAMLLLAVLGLTAGFLI